MCHDTEHCKISQFHILASRAWRTYKNILSEKKILHCSFHSAPKMDFFRLEWVLVFFWFINGSMWMKRPSRSVKTCVESFGIVSIHIHRQPTTVDCATEEKGIWYHQQHTQQSPLSTKLFVFIPMSIRNVLYLFIFISNSHSFPGARKPSQHPKISRAISHIIMRWMVREKYYYSSMT